MEEPVSPAWPSPHATRLQIADWRLDLRNRLVTRDGAAIELTPRVFDLLMALAAAPGMLMTRDRLMKDVWADVVVNDANLTQSIWLIRKAFGETRRHWLKTVCKRGYVFEPDAPVRVEYAPPRTAGSHPHARVASPARALASRRHRNEKSAPQNDSRRWERFFVG